MGRTEIWRSLRTDSLKCAVRRFPLIVLEVEAEIEGVRAQAGLVVDPMLLVAVEDTFRLHSILHKATRFLHLRAMISSRL